MSVGMAIASPRGEMNEGRWSWDSNKKKMTVNLQSDPKHLDVIEIDGGSQWGSSTIANGQTRTEEILKIKHDMPFKPRVLSYFYCYDAPAGRQGILGNYMAEWAPMVFNAVGYGSEELFIRVDEEYLYVMHRATRSTTSSSWQAFGSQFKFRFRYMITNLKHTKDGGW